MLKYLLLSILLLLSGCTTATLLYSKVSNVIFVPKYDTNEYMLTTAIRTKAEMATHTCADYSESTRVFNELYFDTNELVNFTQYPENNKDIHEMSIKLQMLVSQGVQTYKNNTITSTVFCEIKLRQISNSSEAMQKIMSGKSR